MHFKYIFLTFRLKTLREVAFLTDSGNWFHNLGAEEKNMNDQTLPFSIWLLLEIRL